MSGKKSKASKEDGGPGHVAEALEGGGSPAAKKSRRGLMILIILAAVLVIAGAVAGLGFAGIVKIPFLSHHKTKMQAELEVPDAVSAAAVNTQMPAIVDMFQTYLRTMQPGDLQGAEGLYRLREAFLARANVIVAPASVQDVLFIELIVQ